MMHSSSHSEPAISAETSQPLDVALVSMPFGALTEPSLALSLLKAELAPLQVRTSVFYFTIRLAEMIGGCRYVQLAGGVPISFDLLGEWLFAGALFGEEGLDVEGYVDDVLRGRAPAHYHPTKPAPEGLIAAILEVRSQIEAFMDRCLDEILQHRPRIVGFSSVYQQQVASLALAKRIKQAAPDTFIVIGGSNVEGVMGAETIRQFTFVDAVVSGEGDVVLSEIVRHVLAGSPLPWMQGVYLQGQGTESALAGVYPSTPPVKHLDALPYPDFDDYFAQFDSACLSDRAELPRHRILFESSRGCWWGERSHCTFCGLNDDSLVYRSKSGTRALKELEYLNERYAQRYPGCGVAVVDNILEMKYFNDFVPELAKRSLGLDLFYEVKANLKKAQVQQLRDAGITTLQPGIESFSDHTLRLMHKGVSALQSIQLLKWCKELGIRPYWNMLWGFAGEVPAEYERMAQLARLINHLPPPYSAGTLRLDRFSPNFQRAEELGYANVRPYPAYFYIYYPLSQEAIANLAYYFTFGYREPQPVAEYTATLWQEIKTWKKDYAESDLFFIDKENCLLIWDLRPGATLPVTIVSSLHRALYLACDSAQNLTSLHELAQAHHNEPVERTQVEAFLQSLVDSGLMLRDGNRYLSLAIPVGQGYTPSAPVLQRMEATINRHGTRVNDGIALSVNHGMEVMPMP